MKILILLLGFTFALSPVIAIGTHQIARAEGMIIAQGTQQPTQPGSRPSEVTPTQPGSRPAQTTNASGDGVTLMNPLKVDSLEELLAIVLRAIVRLGTIVLTLMLIWVGFMFIKARGNPNELSTAKKALLWTIVGGLILLGAEAIGRVIQATANTL